MGSGRFPDGSDRRWTGPTGSPVPRRPPRGDAQLPGCARIEHVGVAPRRNAPSRLHFTPAEDAQALAAALEALADVVACCTRGIAAEKARAEPDPGALADWHRSRQAAADARRRLALHDLLILGRAIGAAETCTGS